VNRRGFLAATAASLLSHRSAAQQAPSSRPNIVYLHTHDSGRYFRPYGFDIPTPTVDRLAKGGILFRNMHSAAPVCSASRASLLTGQCPHSNGMMGLAHLGWGLHDYSHHFLHTARKYGYHSVLAGLQHIAHDQTVIGYDEILPHTNNHCDNVTPGAVKWLKNAPKQPFFLDCGFTENHRPYAKATDDSTYIQPPFGMPDTPATRRDMADYHATARKADHCYGEVLDALQSAGLLENTLILCTTDHGLPWPDMKAHLRDTGTGVSFILSGPGPFRGGKVCDVMLSHLDVFPTLCDYLGFEKPDWLEGKSFLPLLTSPTTTPLHDYIFTETTYHAAYEPIRAARSERYKYIRHFGGRTSPVLPNCDAGPAKSDWLAHGWAHQEVIPREELFDLFFDPAERNNLATDPAHASALKTHADALQAWMQHTSDPLLAGPVPLPPGGITTDPNAIDPEGPAARRHKP